MRLQIEKQRKDRLKRSKGTIRNIVAKKQKVVDLQSSEEDDTSLSDSGSSEISDEIFDRPEETFNSDTPIKVGDFVLTKIVGKKNPHHYVAEIKKIEESIEVVFLKRFRATNKFVRESDDIYFIDRSDIVFTLPVPESGGFSERQRQMLSFGVDFSSYKVE